AVMARAGAHAPVPPVLRVVPAVNDEARPAMVLEYVPGTLLSDVLATAEKDENDLAELGAEVGRVIAGIGTWSPARRDTPWPTRQPTRSAAGSPTAYRTHQRPRITRCTAMVPACRSGPSGSLLPRGSLQGGREHRGRHRRIPRPAPLEAGKQLR
ncbi:MAG TPA: phosphotransferase, partial [Trebonia sp.]